MTDISKEAVEAHLQFIAHNKVYEKLEDADREAYEISEAMIRALSARIDELEAQIAAARNEALREAHDKLRMKADDGKTQEAEQCAHECADAILALMEDPTND